LDVSGDRSPAVGVGAVGEEAEGSREIALALAPGNGCIRVWLAGSWGPALKGGDALVGRGVGQYGDLG